MTYSTLMVYLDQDRSNDACIRAAGDLAGKFDTRVIGVAACDLSQSAYFAEGPLAADLIEQGRATLRKAMQEMECRFRDRMRGRAASVEWRSAVEFPTQYVTRQVRAADLVIMESRSGEGLVDPLRRVDKTDLLMDAGRPILMVAPGLEWLDTRRVLIGWKDTRETRRAVSDALPLLREAESIDIVEIVEQGEDRAPALARLKDVVAWLAHHDIDATAVVAVSSGEVGGQLETIASDLGAGVVVAGAYGHTRMREWAFGGVTRDLMMTSTRCALLSR